MSDADILRVLDMSLHFMRVLDKEGFRMSPELCWMLALVRLNLHVGPIHPALLAQFKEYTDYAHQYDDRD